MDTDRQGHVRTNSSQNLPPLAVPWKLSPRLIIYDVHLFKFYDGWNDWYSSLWAATLGFRVRQFKRGQRKILPQTFNM